MKQTTLLLLALAVALGSFVLAQDNDRQNNRRQPPALFQQFFTLPGIELWEEKLEKVEELRKEFVPKLTENQNRWNGVITDEQQQARREAFQKARDAGKEGQQLRNAVDAAIKLTEEQKEQQAALRKERDTLLSEIRTQLTALLTDEQRATLRPSRRVQQQNPPTHPNVKYGPHERNVLDVWLAESDKPTPVLVSIHGGGFQGGDKSVSDGLLNPCL